MVSDLTPPLVTLGKSSPHLSGAQGLAQRELEAAAVLAVLVRDSPTPRGQRVG